MPVYRGGEYNFTVDWTSDGTPDGTVTSYKDADAVSPLLGAGTHTVTIVGDLEGWNFSHESTSGLLITDVAQWGDVQLGNDFGYFLNTANLQVSASDAPDLTSITTLEGMFLSSTSLANPDFSSWNTGTITNFSSMFRDATAFNGNLVSWDVSSGIHFQAMFQDAPAFNQELNLWNVSQGQNFSDMFNGANLFNGDVTNWNVEQGTNFQNMFVLATAFDQDLSYWDLSNVNSANGMFNDAATFNQDLSNWEFCGGEPTDFARGAVAWVQPHPTFNVGCAGTLQNNKPAIRLLVDFIGTSGFDQSYSYITTPGSPVAALPEPSKVNLTFTGWFSRESLLNGRPATTVPDSSQGATIAGFIPSELAAVLGLNTG